MELYHWDALGGVRQLGKGGIFAETKLGNYMVSRGKKSACNRTQPDISQPTTIGLISCFFTLFMIYSY